MSSVDTAWLRMDSDGNLMVIVGVYELAGALDSERLRALLASRFASHFRMRARVVQDPTGYFWEEDEAFDIDRHLLRIALPGKGSLRELKRLTGRLASEPLAADRPLWQFHLIDNYRGGQALVARIHHCIADGIALIGVLLAMTSDHAEPDTVIAPQAPRPAGPWDSYIRPMTRLTVKAIDTTGDVAGKVLGGYAKLLTEPQALGATAAEVVRIAAQVAKDAAGIALMDHDTPTSLKGKPSGHKVVAWNDRLPLDEVKAVSRALGCSINDVLLACAAGAIRSYFEHRGEAVAAGCELRAMVPVNLRDPASWKELGNKFGLVPLLLPVGIENPIARVFEVRSRMDELKKSYTAVLAMMVLGAAGLAPRVVQQQALNYLACKGTAVMTNVPGPQQALYVAGAKIERLLFWVPQSGDICVGVSILSYNGGVQFGLITDRSVCSDPQQIIDRFAPEFEKLVLALCLLPWDGAVDAEQAEHWLFPSMPGPSTKARKKVGARRSARHRRPAPPPGQSG